MGYQFTYTRLLVANFRSCFRFYHDLMGFQATFGSEDSTYADFDTGPVVLALFDRAEMSKAVGTEHLPAGSKAQDRFCLIFSVEDVDHQCEQLKKAGIPLESEPADHPDWGIRAAHFRDPDGNLIEINQPLHR